LRADFGEQVTVLHVTCKSRKKQMYWDRPSCRHEKRFHARLRPHQRQVLAYGVDKLRSTLWLKFCFDQHDHLFVRHIGLLLSIFIGRRVHSLLRPQHVCRPHACGHQHRHDHDLVYFQV
jgi:hypothetical protein